MTKNNGKEAIMKNSITHVTYIEGAVMFTRQAKEGYPYRLYLHPSEASKKRIADLANCLICTEAADAVLMPDGWTLFLNSKGG